MNGIEVYHSDQPELFHQLHDTGLQKADDQGKHIAENGHHEKETAEPALARRRGLRLWIALAAFIIIAAAIGGGVGGALSRCKSVCLERSRHAYKHN